MSNSHPIVIRGICERDIDLLLLEEIVASPEFRRWFLLELGVAADATLQSVERSVSTVSGESDIELTLLSGGETVKALVENKIDAVLQPDQAERYRERACAYRDGGRCDRVVTAVIAPAIYFDPEEEHGFDVFVQYEAVLEWFERARSMGARQAYKIAAMRQAIDRGARGWQLVPDATTTRFWKSYWELAQRVAPQLRMPEPDAKPATSNFIRFCPLSLPHDVSLYHKVPYGRVDLQFAGMGTKLVSIEKRFGRRLSREMQVAKAAKSAAIRICVEKVDMQEPFVKSEQHVRRALNAALELLHLHEVANNR